MAECMMEHHAHGNKDARRLNTIGAGDRVVRGCLFGGNIYSIRFESLRAHSLELRHRRPSAASRGRSSCGGDDHTVGGYTVGGCIGVVTHGVVAHGAVTPGAVTPGAVT